MRKIIHIDMDAFFAAIEQLDDPKLRGLPVIVGGDPEKRGVVAQVNAGVFKTNDPHGLSDGDRITFNTNAEVFIVSIANTHEFRVHRNDLEDQVFTNNLNWIIKLVFLVFSLMKKLFLVKILMQLKVHSKRKDYLLQSELKLQVLIMVALY